METVAWLQLINSVNTGSGGAVRLTESLYRSDNNFSALSGPGDVDMSQKVLMLQACLLDDLNSIHTQIQPRLCVLVASAVDHVLRWTGLPYVPGCIPHLSHSGLVSDMTDMTKSSDAH